MNPIVVAGLAVSVATSAAPAAEAGVWRYHDEHILGTRMNLVVVGADEAAGQAAAAAARREIERLDGVLSGYRDDSELARLNRSARMAVSADLYAVVDAAERWRAQTGGAYDGRLGQAISLWAGAGQTPPDRAALEKALATSRAPVRLDPQTRSVSKPKTMTLALDGLAKGYVIDKALAAGRAAAPGARGILLEIGGDIRCWGAAPRGGRWEIGVSDPSQPFANADCAAIARLGDSAIATSGPGPRDRIIDGVRYSPNLSPADGWPANANIAATVVARCAADADALASAFMVMRPADALALAERTPDAAARITAADGRVHISDRWRKLAGAAPARLVPAATPGAPVSKIAPELRWPGDWGVEFVYISPDKREADRASDFRTPYMALWITDANNRPIRTIIMVGRDADWQRDNFVWWNLYRADAARLVDLRSEATALSGRYSLFWRGIDDAWDSVPIGEYILHIETSQERGKHSYRTLKLSIGKTPFQTILPATKEGGGLQISYGLKR